MYDRLERLVAELKQMVEGLDPEVLEPSFAAELVKGFSEAERVCSAGKALAARRVESSGTWKTSGERSAAHWMAKTTGEPLGYAISTLDTAKRVAGLPQTDKALRSGKLSRSQANEIASAAEAAPGFESDLLQAAEVESFSGLRDRCEKVRAGAVADEASRHNAIQRSRRLKTWTDRQGAFRLDALLTPEAGGAVMAALRPLQQQIASEAKKLLQGENPEHGQKLRHGGNPGQGQKRGQTEPYEAYGADALVEMAKHLASCNEQPDGSGPKALVHVRVDHSALQRGHTEPGETCEIADVGPIPVAAARALARDAFLAAIVTDGLDIHSVSHLGRTIPARLRTALGQRDPVCVVPGCNNRRYLEIDHVVPVEDGGPTCLDNLARLCSAHHDQKTYRGYKIRGSPGAWIWDPPVRHPERC